MIFSRGKVFAGRGNSVIVLDPATDAVIKTVTYENRQVKDLARVTMGKFMLSLRANLPETRA